jgi:anti-sigma B factor antagonist
MREARGVPASVFDVDVVEEDGRATVRLSGEVDGAAVERLAPVLDGLAVGDVIVDLGRVVFMDSMGMRVLVELRRRIDAGGGSLTLRNPGPLVCRVLEATNLDRVFIVHRDGGLDSR